MTRTVFLTGATGNIGCRLLLTMLSQGQQLRVIALVRGESGTAARDRLIWSLDVFSPERDRNAIDRRLEVVCGDITRQQLGLSDSDYIRLASRITHVIHAAASTQFTLPLKCARQINVTGTIHVMQLAQDAKRLGCLERVAYIGTAYVCGDQQGTILEDDPLSPRQFSNSYEQSKYEAEQYVRSLAPNLPIIILRPSVVVGDSRTGRTLTLNALYTPLKYIYKGMIRSLSCDPRTPLDVVPLDYVCDVINQIVLHADSAGKTYHIVSAGAAPAVGEIVGRFVEYLRRHGLDGAVKISALRLPDGNQLQTSARSLQLMSVFMPYLQIQRRFDDSNTAAALRGTGIHCPRFADYFKTLLDYCFAADWGRAQRRAA